MIHNCIKFSSLSSMIYQENMRHLLNWNGSKLKPILLDLLLSFPYTVYFRKFTGIILRSCWHSAGILGTGTQTHCLWGGQQLFFLCHTCNETNTLIPFIISRYDEHNSITWSDFVMGCWCRTHSDWQVFIFHWGLYQGTCTRILHCYNNYRLFC